MALGVSFKGGKGVIIDRSKDMEDMDKLEMVKSAKCRIFDDMMGKAVSGGASFEYVWLRYGRMVSLDW